jgi:hypothetical protein
LEGRLQGARRKRNGNIKMDFVEICCEDVNLIQHIQECGQQCYVTEHVLGCLPIAEVYNSVMLKLPSKQRI